MLVRVLRLLIPLACASLFAGSAAWAAAPPPAIELGATMTAQPGLLTGASYNNEEVPPGAPDAGPVHRAFSSPLAGFPLEGDTFAILTTGNADAAPAGGGGNSVDAGGRTREPSRAFDVTVLKLDVNVPASANCLSFDFRFLSAESPGTFNDAFVAELDRTSWTNVDNQVQAPDNFAFNPDGTPITVNGTGVTQSSADNASGTSYSLATQLLRASAQVNPGPHSLYLSILDQADAIVDSAVFVDRMRTTAVAPGQCQPGAVAAELPAPTVGKSANVMPLAGTVLVKLPGASGFIPLDQAAQVPLGSTLDATRGRVLAQTAVGRKQPGKIQSGEFRQGQFQILQRGGTARPITEMVLNSSLTCTRNTRGKLVPARRTRALWGKARGRFRTRGRHSSATVRGTEWLTKDSCGSTTTRVRSGTVVVRDFAKRRNVTLKRGKSYIARARTARRGG